MQVPHRRRRWWFLGGALVLLAAALPGFGWLLLRHRPDFYQLAVVDPPAQLERQARAFLNQSLQLRNDALNEPVWHAEFSDREVNAWLAHDLVQHFADQLPPEISSPRVVFEPGRFTLAFAWHQPSYDTIVWAVLQAHVPEPNTVVLAVEKLRAGALPIPTRKVLPGLIQHARNAGLDVAWDPAEHPNEVRIRYPASATGSGPATASAAVRLEALHFDLGRVRLEGRSRPRPGAPQATALRLPSRGHLQSAFPRPAASSTHNTRHTSPRPAAGEVRASAEAEPDVQVEAARPAPSPRS